MFRCSWIVQVDDSWKLAFRYRIVGGFTSLCLTSLCISGDSPAWTAIRDQKTETPKDGLGFGNPSQMAKHFQV